MKWIKTNKQLPPKGKWVLVTRDDWQKPWEIMCYMGIRTNTITRYIPGIKELIEEEYEYPAWTSGHGDIMGQHPIAWMPLPKQYKK